MYSTYPLLYSADIAIQELGMLPSSAREWQNVKEFQLKRGLIDPPRELPEEITEGNALTYTSFNGGVNDISNILGGRVRKPSQYQDKNELQAYIQLVRDAGREPTDEEILAVSATDFGIDARFIDLLEQQSKKGNYYADEAQNFTRKVQKSVNRFYKENALFKVPLNLEDDASLEEVIARAFQKEGFKGALKETRPAVKSFLKSVEKGLREGKNTIQFFRQAADVAGIQETAGVLRGLEQLLQGGVDLTRIANAVASSRSLDGAATAFDFLLRK